MGVRGSVRPRLMARGGLGRRVVLTWLGVYPVLTALAGGLAPYLSGLPLWLQTLVMSALMVPIMMGVVMPSLNRWL